MMGGYQHEFTVIATVRDSAYLPDDMTDTDVATELRQKIQKVLDERDRTDRTAPTDGR